jgi:thiamine transporter ThiT
MRSRDLAYSALFGAAALLLPTLFHLVHLGHVFMPMYLPLVALAFFVRPFPACLTGLLVPLLSGAVTGMPPFYPPIAVCMAAELASMGALISGVRRVWPRANDVLVLVPVLIFGRILNVGLAYACALLVHLPPAFVAGLSFFSGWPGIALMVVVVPAVASVGRRLGARARQGDEQHG